MNSTDNLFESSLAVNSFEESFASDSYLHLNSNEQTLNTEFDQQENPYEQSLETEAYQHQNPYEQPLNEFSYSPQSHYELSLGTESYQHQNPYEQPLNEFSYSPQSHYELSLGNEFYPQQSPDTSHNAHSNLAQSLTDAGIANKFSESISDDGFLDREEMISIMREAKDGGEIDANELIDLRNIVDKDNFLMSEDVRVLSNKIVNGDPANDHSKIGNLSITKTSLKF